MPATHLRLVAADGSQVAAAPRRRVRDAVHREGTRNHAGHHQGASGPPHAFREPHSVLGKGARGEPWHLPAGNHATSTPRSAMGST
jgi:hypothetical protein